MRAYSRFFAGLGLLGIAGATTSCSWLDGVGRFGDTRARAPVPSTTIVQHVAEGETLTAEALIPPPLPRVKPPRPATASLPPPEAPRMMGLSEDEVERILGPPRAETTAPPARIREYGNVLCTVKLYFYIDLGTETYKVLHLETEPAGLSRAEARRCLTQIARRATQSGGS